MQISKCWKHSAAKLIRWSVLQRLMLTAVRAFVPRHRIGVAVVVLDDQNRILMLEHVFHPYTPWGLPGGWLERGESPRAGALRELREETGFSAHMGPALLISQQRYPEAVNMAFLATSVQGSLRVSGEIIDAQWFAVDQLPEPIVPFTKEAIRRALAVRPQIQPAQTIKSGVA